MSGSAHPGILLRGVLVAVLTVLLIMDYATFMLLLIGMTPTFGAYLSDAGRMKYAARTVGGMNVAALAPYAVDLWSNGRGDKELFQIASDMQTWMVVGLAAAGGWILHMSLPIIIAGLTRVRDQGRIVRLRARQRSLAEDWGDDIISEATVAAVRESHGRISAVLANERTARSAGRRKRLPAPERKRTANRR